MENKYLEKVADHVEDIQKGMNKKWTAWGQRDVLRQHGYDVSTTDMMNLNQQSMNQDLKRTIKNQVGIPVAGAALGTGVGHLLRGKFGPASATIGLIGGATAGVVAGGIKEGNAVKKDQNALIRKSIETGYWKKQASENVYLQKSASKWARRAAKTTQGQELGITSDLNGAGGKIQMGSNRITNNDLLGKINSAQPGHAVLQGGAAPIKQRGFMGLGKEKTIGFTPNTATRLSGDALAAKGEGSVLAKSVANKAEAGKGILSKALGFAKRNPIATGVAALAGGVAIGSKLGQSKQPQQQYYSGY